MDVVNLIESNVEQILRHVSYHLKYKSGILLEQKIVHLTDKNLDYVNKLCEPIC
jgi:hypothetical protein